MSGLLIKPLWLPFLLKKPSLTDLIYFKLIVIFYFLFILYSFLYQQAINKRKINIYLTIYLLWERAVPKNWFNISGKAWGWSKGNICQLKSVMIVRMSIFVNFPAIFLSTFTFLIRRFVKFRFLDNSSELSRLCFLQLHSQSLYHNKPKPLQLCLIDS